MIQAYKDGKDLYAVIASMSFDYPYEECLEFYPEGTKITIDGKEIICGKKTNQNKAGKERRSSAKSVLLGLLYGRSAKAIGEQLGKSKEQAQEIINKFFKAFPIVEKWINNVHKNAKKNGYVEDWYGRRRRLPNITLPMYDVKPMNVDDEDGEFNPFIECSNRINKELNKNIKKYKDKLSNVYRYDEINRIISEAKSNGIDIKCNSNLIAEAERESVNSIIQGGASTLTKIAMINIYNDKELNELGYKLQVTVHDEVLGECPAENSERVAKRLSEVMINSAKPYMEVPMSCDTYNETHWYDSEIVGTIRDEYKKLEDSLGSKDKAVERLCENHPEVSRESLVNVIENRIDELLV